MYLLSVLNPYVLAIYICICFSECPPGYFGKMCKIACSGNCLNNNTCHHIDGTCSAGCQAGYTGKQCNACKIFYFKFWYAFVKYKCFYRHTLLCFILQPAGMGIMAWTVRMIVPLTAKHVNTLMAHAVVLLVGGDPTVALVYD